MLVSAKNRIFGLQIPVNEDKLTKLIILNVGKLSKDLLNPKQELLLLFIFTGGK